MKNAKEICQEFGLDFKIVKLGFAPTIGGDFGEDVMNIIAKHDTPYFGLYNSATGKCLNSVKAGYTVTQNEEIVDMVLKGMANFGELSVQNAGSIGGGKKTFVQLAIEGDGVVNGDTIKRYVTIIDSNDGTSGLAVGIGDLTMSCANQFYHFNKTAQNKFRHSASIADKVKMLPRVIAGSLATSLEVVKLYKAFESTKVSRGLADQLVNALVGIDKSMTVAEMNDVTPSGKVSTRKLNIMEDIYRNIETEMNSKGNSLWGLHSGITRYTTHDMTPSRTGNARLDLVTNVNGAGYKFNQTSLEFAKMVMA